MFEPPGRTLLSAPSSHRLLSRIRFELGHNLAHVIFRAVKCEPKLLGDLEVRAALREQFQHAPLPVAQIAPRRRCVPAFTLPHGYTVRTK